MLSFPATPAHAHRILASMLLLVALHFLIPTAAAVDSNNFDLFFFDRQWPPGTCSYAKCERHPTKNFTVDGLFPFQWEGEMPTVCENAMNFNEEDIADLRPELEKIWPSFSNEESVDLWRSAWMQYGSCSSRNPHEYFSNIIDLHNKYALLDALRSWEMEPSNVETHYGWEIEMSLHDNFGVTPIVKCKGENPRDVVQIRMCFDRRYNPIRCPYETASDCEDHRLRLGRNKHTEEPPKWRVAIGYFVIVMFFLTTLIHRSSKSFPNVAIRVLRGGDRAVRPEQVSLMDDEVDDSEVVEDNIP